MTESGAAATNGSSQEKQAAPAVILSEAKNLRTFLSVRSGRYADGFRGSRIPSQSLLRRDSSPEGGALGGCRIESFQHSGA